MSIIINDIEYFSSSELTESLNISRQTLWRWRQEGKVPQGHRFRDKRVCFTKDEVEIIKDFSTRIEPIDSDNQIQMGLFNHVGEHIEE